MLDCLRYHVAREREHVRVYHHMMSNVRCAMQLVTVERLDGLHALTRLVLSHNRISSLPGTSARFRRLRKSLCVPSVTFTRSGFGLLD